jgi:hypothetical protein
MPQLEARVFFVKSPMLGMFKQRDETLFHGFVNGMEADKRSSLLECPACLTRALPFPGVWKKVAKQKRSHREVYRSTAKADEESGKLESAQSAFTNLKLVVFNLLEHMQVPAHSWEYVL